jgi:hypothetical protein
MPDHVLGDRGLRHRDSNLQQFSVNAGSSPAKVGEAHFPDQIPNFWRYTRSSFKMATLPIPIQSKPLAMSGDDSLRLDKEQCRAPIVPQSRKPARFGIPDSECPALIDAQGRLRDLSEHLAGIPAESLSDQQLEKIAAIDAYSDISPDSNEGSSCLSRRKQYDAAVAARRLNSTISSQLTHLRTRQVRRAY